MGGDRLMEFSQDQLEVARILMSPDGDPSQVDTRAALGFLAKLHTEAHVRASTDYEGNPLTTQEPSSW